LPYVTSERTVYKALVNQQIPPGELAVRRGTLVEATDGYVGKVDQFVVNPENGHITHLVMREGHLWGKKDVIIPVSAMGDTHDDTVFLKLDKHQIESLPTFPLHRRWS
jgi:sporulation protein YlmC with PRC-barrel domain